MSRPAGESLGEQFLGLSAGFSHRIAGPCSNTSISRTSGAVVSNRPRGDQPDVSMGPGIF